MPGIRPHLWDNVYKSILKSTNRHFELIIISPYLPSDFLQGRSNVKYVKDFGSPVRASCIGSLLCEGQYIFPTMADDAFFIEGAIDKNIDLLLLMGENYKNIVTCKYSESEDFSYPERYQSDDYYKVTMYPVNKEHVNENWFIFNAVFLYRRYFEELGGYDCSYNTTCIGHTDLAIRAQKDGANVQLSPYPIIQCDHNLSDHGAIEIAQLGFDIPKFRSKYNKSLDDLPIKINPMNWKKAENVWGVRWGACE